MKFRKTVSALTAAAVSAVCAAGMFSVGTGAFYVAPAKADGTRIESMAEYIDYYFKTNNNVSEMRITNEIDSSTYLTGDTLMVMSDWANKSKRFRIIINDGAAQYTVILDRAFFDKANSSGLNKISNSEPSGIYRSGIDLRLNLSNVELNKTLSISNTGLGSDSSVEISYIFTGNSTLYDFFLNQLDMSNLIREYYLITDPQTQKQTQITTRVFTKDSLNAEKVITFNGQVSKRYYTIVKKNEESYYKKEFVEPTINDSIKKIIGFTDDDFLYYPEVKAYVESVKAQFIDDLYDEELNSRYATPEDVEKEINSYFSAENPENLTALAEALIATQITTVDSEVYKVFGLETTEAYAQVIRDSVIDSIAESIVDTLIGTQAPISNYRTAIRYYLDSTAYDTLTEFSGDLKTIMSRLTKADGQAFGSVYEVISVLKAYETQLEAAGIYDISVKDITDGIAALAASNGISGTLTQVLANLPNYVNTSDLRALKELAVYGTVTQPSGGYTAAGNFSYSNGNYVETSTLNSGYITYQDLQQYLYNQQYAYESEISSLNQQLAVLKSSLESMQNDINSVKNGSGYYSNVDNFVNLVANEVINRIGATGSAGESAYDIAVRNGFKGTESEWLESLVGESAYEIALKNGFTGTESEWLETLKSADSEGKIVYVYGSKNSSAPSAESGSGGQKAAAVSTDMNGSENSSGTATGVAAGVLIPAAALGSVLLLKKDKRRRGRR